MVNRQKQIRDIRKQAVAEWNPETYYGFFRKQAEDRKKKNKAQRQARKAQRRKNR